MLLHYARCSASLLLSRCAHATCLYAVSCAAHFHSTRGALTCFPPAFLLHVAARCPALLPVNGLLIMRAVCSDWVHDRITQCPRKKIRMRGRASLHPGVLWQPRFLNCSPQSCNEGHCARFCGFSGLHSCSRSTMSTRFHYRFWPDFIGCLRGLQ